MDRFTATAIALRGVLAAFLTWLSAKFGVLVPVMGILLLAMALDFVTAWAACILTGESITSKRGGRGILKKVLYIVGVIVGLFADWLILSVAGALGITQSFAPIFGLLVAVWLILNELVSILENIQRAGVKMPTFLMAVVRYLKIQVEEKGDVIENKEEK